MATAPDEVQLRIRCLCGACEETRSVAKKDLPLTANACCCDNCRQNTGALAYGSISWPPGIPNNPNLVSYTRDLSIYYHCNSCGCILFWTQPDGSQVRASGGVIEEPKDAFSFKGFEWIQSTKDGGLSEMCTSIAGKEMERFQFDEYKSDPVPLGWQATPSQEASTDPETETLPAKCLCGQVVFKLTRPKTVYEGEDLFGGEAVAPLWLVPRGKRFVGGLCACTSCRLTSGVDITAWAWVPKVNAVNYDGTRFVPQESNSITTYISSPGVRRYFCNRCGASIACDLDIRPGLIDVAVGILGSKHGALSQDFLEWTHGLSFEEDANNPTFVHAVSKGYDEWRKAKGLFHLKSMRPHGFVNQGPQSTS